MPKVYVIWIIFLLNLVRIAEAAKQKTNILIVTTDDMSATATPPYVHSTHPMYNPNLTPHLHRFLQTATVFHGIAPMPVCGPSRASFLTGRYIDRLDIYNFERFIQQSAPNISTMFKYFKDKLNYESFVAGKIFHTRTGDALRDIEYYTGHISEPRRSTQSGNSECKSFMYCTKEKQSLADTDVVKQLGVFLAKMAQHPEKNFIAGAGLHRPHLTMAIPKNYLNGLRGDLPNYLQPLIPDVEDFFHSLAYKEDKDSGKYKIKISARSWQKLIFASDRKRIPDIFQVKYNYAVREMRRHYYAAIRLTFDNFGTILNYLDLYGFKNNTHVVFVSDHGWQNGERRILGKNTLFPEATRVPLFIHYAGQTQSFVNKHPVSTRDIFPTLIDLVEGSAALSDFNDGSGMPLDGASLVPGLTNPEYKHNRLVFSQYPRCQTIGEIQTDDCMTGINQQCSTDSGRAKIQYMGYTTYTNTHEYTEWRKFIEVRTGISKPIWPAMPQECVGVGCMWPQIDPKLTGTDWSSIPLQRQLHLVADGKTRPENLAINPSLVDSEIINAESERLKQTLLGL